MHAAGRAEFPQTRNTAPGRIVLRWRNERSGELEHRTGERALNILRYPRHNEYSQERYLEKDISIFNLNIFFLSIYINFFLWCVCVCVCFASGKFQRKNIGEAGRLNYFKLLRRPFCYKILFAMLTTYQFVPLHPAFIKSVVAIRDLLRATNRPSVHSPSAGANKLVRTRFP